MFKGELKSPKVFNLILLARKVKTFIMNVFYFPLVKPLSHVGTDGIVLLAQQIAVCCQLHQHHHLQLHQPQPHHPQLQPRSHKQQQPLQIKFVMMSTSTFSIMEVGILILVEVVIVIQSDIQARTGKGLVI